MKRFQVEFSGDDGECADSFATLQGAAQYVVSNYGDESDDLKLSVMQDADEEQRASFAAALQQAKCDLKRIQGLEMAIYRSRGELQLATADHKHIQGILAAAGEHMSETGKAHWVDKLNRATEILAARRQATQQLEQEQQSLIGK